MSWPAPSRPPQAAVGRLHAALRGAVGLVLMGLGLAATENLPLSFAELAAGFVFMSTAVTRTCPLCRAFRRLLHRHADGRADQ